MRAPLIAVLVLPLFSLLASPALAAWPTDPTTNLPLCTATNEQQRPTIISDGAGGAIVTWDDTRGADADIYVQRVTASGAVAAGWPADGRALCTAANTQLYPKLVSDGAGGAIVTWMDLRGGTSYEAYAQHVLASGAVDPAWPVDGRALTSAANLSESVIVSDGTGGAIVAWTNGDIFAQRVLASGVVDPAWPANGRALCTAADFQAGPAITSDGAGGAIVAWHDPRTGFLDIYAQRVLASGAVDPAWPANGRALCTAASGQLDPTIVSDMAGGAIVAWMDGRGASYAQRVLASGAVDPAWPLDGRALGPATSGGGLPEIASDGAGGAIVAWLDYRSSVFGDIYGQRVLASGALDPAWPAGGRGLCTAANEQGPTTIVSDGQGGAIVTWADLRSGTDSDIYAHRVLASGAVDPAWPADGRAVSTSTGEQQFPMIAPDGFAGAIVTWQDGRGADNDIYAQRVRSDGSLGGGTSAVPLSRPASLTLLAAGLLSIATLSLHLRKSTG